MQKRNLVVSLLGAALVSLLVGCHSTQTDQFQAKPKARSEAAQPIDLLRAPSDARDGADVRTATFEARRKANPNGGGVGPNAGALHVAGMQQTREVHFIKVGQGDAALLKLPNHTNILVDAGSLHERAPQAFEAMPHWTTPKSTPPSPPTPNTAPLPTRDNRHIPPLPRNCIPTHTPCHPLHDNAFIA